MWFMSSSAEKAARGGLIWSLLGGLLSAALVAAVACAGYRNSVTLEMSWKRGDNFYGPNFIHLESACLSNPEPGCFCSLDIKTPTSKELADYVESFGSNKVPVKFYVDYDRNHDVVGAILEGVGEWPEDRFHIKGRSLATGFRMLPNKRASGGHVDNPADCFPKSVK
jgi:hypothetical protein